jgi:hypothetical protein
MPDPLRLIRTLTQAAAAFRTMPGRQGRFLALDAVGEVLIAGDLHGHLGNFRKLLTLAELDRNPKRHLVLQELIHGPYRYPETGGDQSHRLLDLLAALKCQFPRQVHLLLGNHELSQWTRRAIVKNDEDLNQLFLAGIATAYGEHADAIAAAYDELFAVIPAAIRTPNRVFLSHSLPHGACLDRWELATLVAGEPPPEEFRPGGNLHALVWSRDLAPATTERFLHKVGAELAITGHIHCDDGVQVPGVRQLILDSSHERACVCLFPADRPLTQEELLKGVMRL